jgi:hypothetical protein
MGWVAVGMVGAMAMEARTRRRHGKGRLIRIRGNNEAAQFLHFWYDPDMREKNHTHQGDDDASTRTHNRLGHS